MIADGVLKIRPLVDTPLEVNGRSFTHATTPAYDLGDDDFLLAGPVSKSDLLVRRVA